MQTHLISLPASLACLALLAAAPLAARAQLTYENVNGAGLIYDAVDNVYWTQDADITGQLYDWQDANTWATTLSYAGIGAGNWQLPNGAEFTYMFDQLPANGSDNTDHFGSIETFGAGPNDYASNVEPEYWTSTDQETFNFYYGYTGGVYPPDTDYSAWAVTPAPEPSAAALISLAAAAAAWRWRKNKQ